MAVKHLRFTIVDIHSGKTLRHVKCNVSGASYNVHQRARNCISNAVSRMGCEERGINWGRRTVDVVGCHKRRR